MPPAAMQTSILVRESVARNIKESAPSVHLNGEKTRHNSPKQDGSLAELDASLLQESPTATPRAVPAWGANERSFQKICTDHMVTAQWDSESGWSAPKLEPFGPLAIMPSASCLHYATQCFEGLKLYRGYDGKLRLFRPELNASRLLISATRIALPAFNPKDVLALMVALCARDGPRWLKDAGTFLYMRPLMIGNDPALGVKKPNEAMLCIMLACYLTMDHGRFANGLRVLASCDNVRSWPGGFGFAKVGANYGPTLAGQAEALEKQYDQILWLFGSDGEITEAGAANIFFIWKTPGSDRLQLVTPHLLSQLILEGVTRRSVIELARERLPELDVIERRLTIEDVVGAAEEDRLLECFVTGTAYFVVGVQDITWQSTIHLPVGERSCGPYALKLKTWLEQIMYGEVEHEWGYVVHELG